MNAKLFILALLVSATTGLRAQDITNATMSHEELMRRAARSKPESKTANAAEPSTAAAADWSATNSPRPVDASAEKKDAPLASKQDQINAAIAAAAASVPATNTTPPLRPARKISLPPPGISTQAAPAAATPAAISPRVIPTPAPTAPAIVAPGLSAENVALRPPASANDIPDPNVMMPAGSINWTAATLEQVLTIYSEFVGRNLLRPATLPKAEIVLKQTTPLTKLEVVRMIEAALSLNQVSVINVGEKFVTVMPSAEAYKIPGIINTNIVGDLPVLGSMVTHVVQLKYTKPSEIQAILVPFASGTAANPVMPVDSSGILVLRDNVANVKRMLEMIDKVDVVAQSEIISEVIPIKYAKAEEISSALGSVGGGGGGTIGTRASSSSSGSSSGFNRNTTGQQGGYNQPGAMPGAQPTPSGGGTFGDRLQNIIRKASSSGDLTILGSTKIIADIRSNSLLVFASRQDMEMIKDIISKLDVVLAQVLIETIIMDVSIDDTKSLGVSAVQRPTQIGDDVTVAGGYNNGQPFFNFFNNASNAFPGNLTTTLPGGFSYFGKLGSDYLVALNAAATEGRATIVQKPRILTSHAKEGHIFLGESRAIVSSTYYGGGFGGGPSSSYQQQQAGIDLTVTPFVNTEGLVVMEINQEISDFKGSTEITGVGAVPNIIQRSIRGEVAVNDGETVILGGIILDRKEEAKSGVPFLMDIPLLGRLFSNTRDIKGRSELVVLMRPKVLKTPELVAKYTIVEKESMPGIMAAEADIAETNLERQEKYKAKYETKKDSTKKESPKKESTKPVAAPPNEFKEVTPFTAEDELFLLSPTPPNAAP